MVEIQRFLLIPGLTLLAAACTDHGIGQGSVFQHFDVVDGTVVVHSRTAPDATIDANGQFAIDGKTAPLSDAQHELFRHYRERVLALRHDAVETGKAGAATGVQAIASVASGLANGTPEKIDEEIQAKAAKVEAHAKQVCGDLADIRSIQQSLVTQLPAFAPYATIEASMVADCSQRTKG
jgi:hypothetical protein